MDQRARDSDPRSGQLPTDKFCSLCLARAYIDTVRESVGSLGGALIDALKRLDDAYNEFPELGLERPRGELLEGMRSVAESMPDRAAIPLLIYCVAASPSSSPSLVSLVEKIIKSDYSSSLSAVLRLLCHCREFCWGAIEPLVNVLLQHGRQNAVVQVISGVLGCTEFTKEESASKLGDILKRLLSDQQLLGIESGVLAQAVWSARRRLSRLSSARHDSESRAVLLAMAKRLRSIMPPTPLSPYHDLGWPSSRMSFDEFLLQWPCEVELPVELDDTTFIEEAYRAILLRAPDIGERSQYLRLLQDGVASKSWIIEDLLASKELRSLERRVRVICGGQLITEPGSSEEQEMPAVTWPWRSAG
jgi:hypothetical protein